MTAINRKLAKPTKKNFASFNSKQAFKQLNLTDLQPWEIAAIPAAITPFFQERLARLRRHFDLDSGEEAKKLLIDAICDEALEGIERIKLWKAASLEGEHTAGIADYLAAERKRYLEAPFLCIIEAKKDDFEQGLAQCLVEMQACQWSNQKLGRSLDVLGIVTNGEGWKFYKLATTGEAYETLLYSINELERLLGTVRWMFQICEQNLQMTYG